MVRDAVRSEPVSAVLSDISLPPSRSKAGSGRLPLVKFHARVVTNSDVFSEDRRIVRKWQIPKPQRP